MIDRDAWTAALREVREVPLPPSDGLTVKELAAVFGCSRSEASRKVDVLVSAGKATQTTKAVRRSDGGIVMVPAYCLKK